MKSRISHGAAAVVTGAGGGIGRAFALELARRGGAVLCADLNLEAAQETAQQVRRLGAHAESLLCDVGHPDQVEQLAARSEGLLGRPASLAINNAGVGAAGKVGETSLEDWRWLMDVNLWGVVYGCHFFVPLLKRRGAAGLINVASAAGFGGMPNLAAYNVSKAGVIALSETLAAELLGTGVSVNVLCPTMVPTQIVRNARVPASLSAKGDAAMSRFVFTTTEAVVTQTLDRLDAGALYTVPQVDAKLIWLVKRAAPSIYAGAIGRFARRFIA